MNLLSSKTDASYRDVGTYSSNTMKLSQKKQNEIEVWEYFMPSNCDWAKKTEKDIEMFFEWSEQGKHKEFIATPTFKPEGRTYFHALVWGKKWAGINMHELYEPGILDGTMPYHTLLGGYDKTVYRKWWQFWKPKRWHKNQPIPRAVVDFMKKELFRGRDADLIENIYQQLKVDINK